MIYIVTENRHITCNYSPLTHVTTFSRHNLVYLEFIKYIFYPSEWVDQSYKLGVYGSHSPGNNYMVIAQ